MSKLERMVGYIPIGTTDLIRVLTHPDMLDHTEGYVRAKRLEDEEAKGCPYCSSSWEHCAIMSIHRRMVREER